MPHPSHVILRPQRSTAVSIDPTDLAPLLVLDDQSDKWSDDGVTPIVADDPIYRWDDRSGNGNNASQTTLGLRPLHKTSVLNSKAVARFDGTDDFIGTDLFGTDQPVTVFCVFSTTGGSNVDVFEGNGSNPTRLRRGATNWTINANTDLDSGIAVDTNAHVATVVFNADNSSLRIDGVQGTVGVAGTNFGQGWYLGGSSAFLAGDIAAFIVFEAILSRMQRDGIELFLATRYGITLS